MDNKCQVIELHKVKGEKGNIVIAEGNLEIPFDIKRIFYIYEVSRDTMRGAHANRNSEFVLICVKGSVKVKIKYAKEEEIYTLDVEDKGLYIPKMVWKEMYDFSEDAILLCISSKEYDPQEYIREYDKFLQEVSL